MGATERVPAVVRRENFAPTRREDLAVHVWVIVPRIPRAVRLTGAGGFVLARVLATKYVQEVLAGIDVFVAHRVQRTRSAVSRTAADVRAQEHAPMAAGASPKGLTIGYVGASHIVHPTRGAASQTGVADFALELVPTGHPVTLRTTVVDASLPARPEVLAEHLMAAGGPAPVLAQRESFATQRTPAFDGKQDAF